MAGNQWPLIRAERVALIADLENLTDAQWSTPSLCAEWTVRDVLAHMTMTAKMTPGRFIGKLASSGFRFNAMNAKGVQDERGATPADTLTKFKAQLDRTTAPPGPLDGMVAEIVIHARTFAAHSGSRTRFNRKRSRSSATSSPRAICCLAGSDAPPGLPSRRPTSIGATAPGPR